MDKSNFPKVMYLAPGADSASHGLQLPGAMRRTDFPAVDDHVVVPETGTEMIHGEVRKVLPALSPHANEQARIATVISLNVAPGYTASTELLTRVDSDNDFATDACIHKLGHDPETGSRYLEELSFEVKHTQSNTDITDRARMLVRRGVRRVFAIHVRENEDGTIKAGPVKEWLPSEDGWLELHPDFQIEDHCLIQPIAVKALIDAAEAKNQAARALLAENNPVIVKDKRKALEAQKQELSETHREELLTRERELSEAHREELLARERTLSEAHRAELLARERALSVAHARQAIVELCEVLAIPLSAERRAGMDAMSGEELDALRSALRRQRRWP